MTMRKIHLVPPDFKILLGWIYFKYSVDFIGLMDICLLLTSCVMHNFINHEEGIHTLKLEVKAFLTNIKLKL